jgi:hypothetical protein
MHHILERIFGFSRKQKKSVIWADGNQQQGGRHTNCGSSVVGDTVRTCSLPRLLADVASISPRKSACHPVPSSMASVATSSAYQIIVMKCHSVGIRFQFFCSCSMHMAEVQLVLIYFYSFDLLVLHCRVGIHKYICSSCESTNLVLIHANQQVLSEISKDILMIT